MSSIPDHSDPASRSRSDPLAGLDPAALLAAGLPTRAPGDASAAPPPTPEALAPEFPGLEIVALLGRGGMGAVYKARQRNLDRIVALKILRPGLDADPGFAERFTREARALARLNHPGIVTLYEFGKTSVGRYFILMEFVDGVNLRQLLAAGRLSPREALAIVPPLCDALQYAHDLGLVHRDIKPENLLIDRRGRIKIADFGIARLAADSGTAVPGSTPPPSPEHTRGEECLGTPAYMAPEQREHPAEVDHRADLYALGVVLYQMLTGELPEPGALRPPSTRVHIDVRLDEVVLRALQADPSRRYASAVEFKTSLATATETTASAARVVGRSASRHRSVLRVFSVAALVLLALSLLVFALRWSAVQPAPATSRERAPSSEGTGLAAHHFGPERELAFPRGAERGHDLDQARDHAYAPHHDAPFGIHGSIDWRRSRGIDLFRDGRGLPNLGVEGTRLFNLPREAWHETADQLVARVRPLVNETRHGVYTSLPAPLPGSPPSVHAAVTLQGGLHLLQVFPPSDNGTVLVRSRPVILSFGPIQAELDPIGADTDSVVLNLDTGLTAAAGTALHPIAVESFPLFHLLYALKPAGDSTSAPTHLLASRAERFHFIRVEPVITPSALENPASLHRPVADLLAQVPPATPDGPISFHPLPDLDSPRAVGGDWFAFSLQPTGQSDRRVGILRAAPTAEGRLRLEVRLLPAPLVATSPTSHAPDAPADLRAQPIQLAALDWLDHAEAGLGQPWLPSGEVAPPLPGGRPAPAGIRFRSAPDSTPRFLSLWFTHPHLDRQSFIGLTFHDIAANRPLAGLHPASASHFSPAEEFRAPWLTVTQSPGMFDALPERVRIALHYAVDPWEFWDNLPPDSAHRRVETGAHFEPPENGPDGRALVKLTRDPRLDSLVYQFDLVAVTRLGRRLESHRGHLEGSQLRTEFFRFETPLSQVESFEIRRRPSRFHTWDAVLRPERIVVENRFFRLDRSGDTMDAIVTRLHREFGLRLALEDHAWKPEDRITLGARLEELGAREKRGILQDGEVALLQEARRLRHRDGISLDSVIDYGPRHFGIAEGSDAAAFLHRLVAPTGYRVRRMHALWVIETAGASRLDYPVTLDTAGLTVAEALHAIAEQSPSGERLSVGPIVRLGATVFGVDREPWLNVDAPPLALADVPAREALTRLATAARPASLWRVAGPAGQGRIDLVPDPTDATHRLVGAAQEWLQTLDRGRDDEARRELAAGVAARVRTAPVEAALQERAALGAPRGRRLRSVVEMPAPDPLGHPSWRLEFEAEFAGREGAVRETVVLAPGADGRSRVSVYSIQ